MINTGIIEKAPNTLNWESSFKEKFHPSWWKWMQGFVESKECWDIYQTLKKEKDVIVPASKDTFKSFNCNFDDIKLVVILSDPYPWIKNGIIISDGIPMSCSNTGILQPSLEQWYTAMSNELKKEVYREPNLEYLVQQGVFIINSSLTCRAGKVGSHSELWLPMWKYIFEEAFYTKTGIIYWFLGKEAKRLAKWANPLGNYLFYTSHPASASHKGLTWLSEGMFKSINKVLKDNNNDVIYWDKKDFDREFVPF